MVTHATELEEVAAGATRARHRRLGPPSFDLRALFVVAVLYLLGSLVVWWHVWSTSPTSVTTCGCGDSALFLWFFEWPAHALSNGLSPFFSTAMSYPTGTNLLANTSVLGMGVPLVPVAWLFGPVASLNVALLLAPALSALAMYVLASRFVTWTPAAFAAGVFYGFSPMVLVSLNDAHLMLGMAAIPPLMVAVLDSLVRTKRGRPVVGGILLGILVALQFFIGTEVLLICALIFGAAFVVVVAVAAIGHREVLMAHLRHTTIGLGVAALVALMLLAYPAWFALLGPAHISGRVWPTISLAVEGATLKALVVPMPASISFLHFTHRVGGSQGLNLSGQYFGFGAFIVAGLAIVLRWRDRVVWLLVTVTALCIALSLGQNPHHWLPWSLLGQQPVFENIIPSRFLLLAYMTVALLVALAAEAAYQRLADGRSRGVAVLVAGLLLAVAVIPPLSYLAPTLPLSTQRVVLPRWFQTVAPKLPPHQVLLVFPVPFALIESSMAWQAVARMPYSMVGGGGPDGVPERAGIEQPGQQVIADASFSFVAHTYTPHDIAAVRFALNHWGVTGIVLPDQANLPAYDQMADVTTAAALMTAATGTRPIWQASAWVWRLSRATPAPRLVSSEHFSSCTLGKPSRGVTAVSTATACILASPVP